MSDLIKTKQNLLKLIKEAEEQFSGTGKTLLDIEDYVAEYLTANGVIVLPCKVGSTIYRIDYMSKPCSHEGECYDEFYCRNCRFLLNGDCDSRKEPYIYEIKNANAQTILGNEHLIGTRVFFIREEAEAKIERR